MNEYEKFLIEIGANKINHHGRFLLEHLKGTQKLLSEWGNNKDIVIAGLFHSIYGTQEFKESALSIQERDKVISLIGKESEELVYYFCVADRKQIYKQNNKPPFYILSSDETKTKISQIQYTALIEIEVANIVEQALHQKNVPTETVTFWLNSFKSKHNYISPKGAESYIKVLSNYVG